MCRHVSVVYVVCVDMCLSTAARSFPLFAVPLGEFSSQQPADPVARNKQQNLAQCRKLMTGPAAPVGVQVQKRDVPTCWALVLAYYTLHVATSFLT